MFADMVCIDFDGAVADACLLALAAALKTGNHARCSSALRKHFFNFHLNSVVTNCENFTRQAFL